MFTSNVESLRARTWASAASSGLSIGQRPAGRFVHRQRPAANVAAACAVQCLKMATMSTTGDRVRGLGDDCLHAIWLIPKKTSPAATPMAAQRSCRAHLAGSCHAGAGLGARAAGWRAARRWRGVPACGRPRRRRRPRRSAAATCSAGCCRRSGETGAPLRRRMASGAPTDGRRIYQQLPFRKTLAPEHNLAVLQLHRSAAAVATSRSSPPCTCNFLQQHTPACTTCSCGTTLKDHARGKEP